MALVEAVTLSVGPAIAKAILKLWLKDSVIATSALSSVVDVLAKKTGDVLAQQRGKREFEAIGETVATSLLPLFDEFRIDEEEKAAVALGVAQTLETTPLQADLLVTHDLEPTQLATYLLQDESVVTRDLSEGGAALYRRNMQEIAAYVVDIASQLPAFTEQTFAEILKRERQLLNITKQILEEVRKIRAESIEANTEAAAARFEEAYRRTVVRKLDELELFGVDVSNAGRRHRLSVAYVTLSVTQEQLGDNFSADRFDEDNGDEDEELDTTITLSAHAALADAKRLIVRGDPGSGKTTLLKWVAVHAALRKFTDELTAWNNTVPFFIRLRQLKDASLPSPEAFPKLIAPAIADTMPHGWVHCLLEEGRAVILIDGLDEVSATVREDVHAWVHDLTATYEECRFVISSRPYAIDEHWLAQAAFVDAELQPMEPTDIDTFIEHWHNAVAEQLQDEEQKAALPDMVLNLKATLRRTRSIANLATNPLLCAMLCAIHHDQKQKLPEDRIELYEACCQMLLVRRDEERAVSLVDYPKMSYREKKMLLWHLAYWMIDNGHTMVEMTRADSRFAAKLPESIRLKENDPALVRDFFIQRSGMLREPLPGMVDFTHRTFQEYLAAAAAIDEDNVGVLVDHAHDVQWREVVILAAGLGGKAQRQELLRGLLARGDAAEEERHTLHMLAVSCLDTATELDREIQTEIQSRLAALIPPQSMTEAKALAAAGELAIPHLHYRKALKAKEAAASIRVLTLIGGDAAEATLTGYVQDARTTVKKELLSTTESVNAYVRERQLQPNLTSLDLSYTQVSDVSALAALTNLTQLDLRHTQVSDVSALAALTNLTQLDLYNTQVSDVSALAALTNLTHLNLRSTKVSDVSALAALTNLTQLDLDGTKVSDVSVFAALTNLTHLNLRSTQVSDVSALAALTNLTQLDLYNTQVSDVSALAALTNLTQLDLRHTQVSDVSALAALTNLTQLDLYNTQVSDVSALAALTNLTHLNLRHTQVSDVSALAALTNLTQLNLDGTQVSDVSVFAALTNLTQLDLYNTKVSDVSAFAALTNLTYIDLRRTSVIDIAPLTKLTKLEVLHVWNMRFTGQLVLTNLTSLDLRSTKVSDVSALAALTNLTSLDLRSTQVSDVSALAVLTNLTQLNLSGPPK